MEIRCTQPNHLQIIGVCIDTECKQQRPYCHYCQSSHSQHQINTIPFEIFPTWIKEKFQIVQDMQNQISECQSSLQTMIDTFLPYSNSNVENLGLSELSNLIKGVSQIEAFEKQYSQKLKQSIDQIKLIADQTKKNMKSLTNQKQLNNTLIQTNELQNSKQLQMQQQQNPFVYELIDQNSIQQKEGCRAIAFNKDNSIVIAACDCQIKVYNHDKGKLNYIQALNEHKDNVITLNFMMKSDRFVSGSLDNTIIIWQYNQLRWSKQQQLIGHSNSIICLLLNNKEDLIISGSKDCTIKFWVKLQDIWQIQQSFNEHKRSINSICLNEQQNQLISCSLDKSIQVLQLQELDNKWVVQQSIELNQYGYRLCFINDKQFVYQPYCVTQMQVYDFDQNTKQYKKTNEILVRCGSTSDTSCFQMQYLKSKCLLFNKNGMFINILRKIEDNQFNVEQYIQFYNHVNYGQLSQDGDYLINWDMATRKIQIRKYQELQ